MSALSPCHRLLRGIIPPPNLHRVTYSYIVSVLRLLPFLLLLSSPLLSPFPVHPAPLFSPLVPRLSLLLFFFFLCFVDGIWYYKKSVGGSLGVGVDPMTFESLLEVTSIPTLPGEGKVRDRGSRARR